MLRYKCKEYKSLWQPTSKENRSVPQVYTLFIFVELNWVSKIVVMLDFMSINQSVTIQTRVLTCRVSKSIAAWDLAAIGDSTGTTLTCDGGYKCCVKLETEEIAKSLGQMITYAQRGEPDSWVSQVCTEGNECLKSCLLTNLPATGHTPPSLRLLRRSLPCIQREVWSVCRQHRHRPGPAAGYGSYNTIPGPI